MRRGTGPQRARPPRCEAAPPRRRGASSECDPAEGSSSGSGPRRAASGASVGAGNPAVGRITPVLVAIIKEGLQRPTEVVSRAVPVRGAARGTRTQGDDPERDPPRARRGRVGLRRRAPDNAVRRRVKAREARAGDAHYDSTGAGGYADGAPAADHAAAHHTAPDPATAEPPPVSTAPAPATPEAAPPSPLEP